MKGTTDGVHKGGALRQSGRVEGISAPECTHPFDGQGVLFGFEELIALCLVLVGLNR